MSDDAPSRTVQLEEELLEYRRLLMKEVENHRRFSRITVLTALGLLGLGITVAFYVLPILGYLLVIVGVLRFLNTFYDLQREDQLKTELKLMERKFARHRKSREEAN